MFSRVLRPAGPRWSGAFAATALFFASCAPESPEEPDAPPPSPAAVSHTVQEAVPLTSEGWGPIRIGMGRAEVVAVAGEDADPGAVGGPEPEACDQFRPEQAPEGMLLMIEQGRLTRITMSAGAPIKTERGFGVGDAAGPIRDAYAADAVVSPHKYVSAPAEYITVWMTAADTPDARGLVYEIGPDGRVAHIHVGSSSIQYVEGCL